MTLYCTISCKPNKNYKIVTGNTQSNCFSEELDSGTIILDHVSKEDRLSNIKPYNMVRLFNDEEGTKAIYFVDSFYEKCINIRQKIYQYTINLMSLTKILEKIQLPNLVITHEITTEGISQKETIYEYIRRYVELYAPVVKVKDGNSWKYNKIIDIPGEGTDFYNKFNVPCADLNLTSPTLRQALTTLMQQVSCIPTIVSSDTNNIGTLSYLDYKDPNEEFIIPEYSDEFNFINRSLSSDSYVNTLVTIPSNVLDSENEVICESLGFRDRNKAVIKQTENLFLETKFPIYKINKCIMKAPYLLSVKISSGTEIDYNNDYGWIPYFVLNRKNNDEIVLEALKLSNKEGFAIYELSAQFIDVKDIEIVGHELVIKNISENDIKLVNAVNINFSQGYGANENYINAYTFRNIPLEKNLVAIKIQLSNSDNSENRNYVLYYYIPPKDTYSNERCYPIGTAPAGTPLGSEDLTNIRYDYFPFPIFFENDITKLVKESNERNLLDTNFVEARKATTIDDLSKFLYGTIGYSIGSTQINGFSSMYSVKEWNTGTLVETLAGWNSYTYTYIEHIYRTLLKNNPILSINENNRLLVARSMFIYNTTTNIIIEEKRITDDKLNLNDLGTIFSNFTFDLYYQPLNSFNLSFVKQDEDVPYAIEQFDGSSSAISDFDRLSLSEQEKVDKIGQETIQINQRTKNFDHVKNINTKFTDDNNEYIIFKRNISYDNYFYNVSYVGAKNSILKNYFTSIRTKYRAYQYVDYSQSVVRKEKDLIFIRVTENEEKQSDTKKIKLNCPLSYFFDGIKDTTDENAAVYVVEKGYNADFANESTKNDLSIITTNNILAFIYEQPDNIGSGTYLKTISVDDNVGGISQAWQKWSKDFHEKHIVAITKKVDSYQDEDPFWLNKALRLPIIDKNNDNFNVNTDNRVLFKVVTNDYDNSNRVFYKDLAERINHTIQFIYYSQTPNILFTEKMLKNSSIVKHTFSKSPDYVMFLENEDEFYVSNEEYFSTDSYSVMTINNAINVNNIINISDNKITINWNLVNLPNIKVIKIVSSVAFGNGFKYNDYLAIRKQNSEKQEFYFSLTDTKSDTIFEKQNGLLVAVS